MYYSANLLFLIYFNFKNYLIYVYIYMFELYTISNQSKSLILLILLFDPTMYIKVQSIFPNFDSIYYDIIWLNDYRFNSVSISTRLSKLQSLNFYSRSWRHLSPIQGYKRSPVYDQEYRSDKGKQWSILCHSFADLRAAYQQSCDNRKP